MSTNSDKKRGVFLCLTGIILISPDTLILRLIGADLWTLAFWRGGLSAMGLAIVVLFMEVRQRGQQSLIRLTQQGVVVAFSFTVANIAFIFSIMNTAVANNLVIMSLSTMCAALLSHFFFREYISTCSLIAAIIIFLGLTIVFYGSLTTGSFVGDLAALVTSICLAVSLVLIRKNRTISMVPALSWSSALSCLVALPFALPTSLSGTSLTLLLILGLIVLPVSLALIGLAPQYLPAPEVSLIMRLEALLAPLWVWLVLGEVPSRQTLIGGGIILATLICLSLYTIRMQRGRTA